MEKFESKNQQKAFTGKLKHTIYDVKIKENFTWHNIQKRKDFITISEQIFTKNMGKFETKT